MTSSPTLDVSFLVPTLNRGDYLLRAVQSGLDAIERAGMTGEVVVLDSKSDDGSWEKLEERYRDDSRVRLYQNERGQGLVKCWLDNIVDLQGRFVTFIWSDDYIADHFLTTLAGPLAASEAKMAVGLGPIRDVDCNDPLPSTGDRTDTDLSTLMLRYLDVRGLETERVAVSPACALFTRDAFDHWTARVRSLTTGSPMRSEYTWRRGIGADLLVYLVALADQRGATAPIFSVPTAQFSSHEGSISISTFGWIMDLGYWLSRIEFATDPILADTIPAAIRGRVYGSLLFKGALLRRNMIDQPPGFGSRAEGLAALDVELASLRAVANRNAGALATRFGELQALLMRTLRRAP